MSRPHIHLPAGATGGAAGPRRSRRLFLADLGKGAFALAAVPTLAACSGDDEEGATATVATTASSTGIGAPGTETATAPAQPTATSAESMTTTPATGTADAAGAWHRVALGGVSAYALVRAGEVAIVDTGNPGSMDDFEAMFESMGLRWEDVGHVVLTHRHNDHQGSLPEIMALATDATAYCGAGDLDAISSPRPLVAVGTGDTVFGVEIIETPGHTPGHISVLDRAASVLVAGDAMNGSGGGVAGPNERFTPDMDTAWQSVATLAGYEYATAYFGHGEPVLTGASAAVAALVASRG